MIKIIEITSCFGCLHCGPNNDCHITYNDNDTYKDVEDITTIPDWCPLDSKDEYVEANFNIDNDDT